MSIQKLRLYIPVWGLLTLLLLGACNSKKEEVEEVYTPSGNVAVTAFSLKANSDVAPKLDSVFFAIDLNARIIFNADSLPVGANVKSLVPVISYPSTVGAVEIKAGDKTVNYIETPSSEIDFTNPVTLTLTAADGSASRSYTVKVNVHQQNPAQLLWSQQAVSQLPGTVDSPATQKTLKFKEEVLCFILGEDGRLNLNRAMEPDDSWTSAAIQLPFTPDLRSICAGQNSLFMLSQTGELFSSADGADWNACGASQWKVITGPYLDGVTGIREESGKLIHTSWGAGDIPESEVEDDFPISGFTSAATVISPWSPWPTIFVYGGRHKDGSLSGHSWGFDGESWTRMSSSEGPAVEDAILIPYWISRSTSTMWVTDDRDAWLIIGGRKEDGTPNREVWYSLDNGVNWKSGGANMTQPEEMPGFISADGIVSLKKRSASAVDFKEGMRRLNVSVEGTTILWECPLIFIFGGVDDQGQTANTIWRAALARYTFTPII